MPWFSAAFGFSDSRLRGNDGYLNILQITYPMASRDNINDRDNIYDGGWLGGRA